MYQNKELVFYLWLANMLMKQWMCSEVFPWLGIVLCVGAPYKSTTKQNIEKVFVPRGYTGATFYCALATKGGLGQKLAAVRLLRYCSYIFL